MGDEKPMSGIGSRAARDVLVAIALRAARELRNASRNCFSDEPEASEAWSSLDEALAALDDHAAMQTSLPDARGE